MACDVYKKHVLPLGAARCHTPLCPSCASAIWPNRCVHAACGEVRMPARLYACGLRAAVKASKPSHIETTFCDYDEIPTIG